MAEAQLPLCRPGQRRPAGKGLLTVRACILVIGVALVVLVWLLKGMVGFAWVWVCLCLFITYAYTCTCVTGDY